MSVEFADELANSLQSMPLLETLSFSSTLLGHMSGGLTSALRCLSSLREFHLSGNQWRESLRMMRSQCVDELVQVLQFTPLLEILNIERNDLKATDLSELMPVISNLSHLHTLNLGHNQFGELGSQVLALFLPQIFTLKNLNLFNTGINPKCFELLVPAFQSMDSLQSLQLGGNLEYVQYNVSRPSQTNLSLKEKYRRGLIFLAAGLHSMRSLETLDLSYNFLAVGCTLLATALESMEMLLSLKLEDTQIDFQACIALGVALRSQTLPLLQTLNLCGNSIGDRGCLVLVAPLQSLSPSLQTLNLGRNGIGYSGCEALENALRSMEYLQTLDLHDNKIKICGRRVLEPAYQSMSSLQTLILHNNYIDVTIMVPTFQLPGLLRTLDLGNNRLRYVGCLALAPALQTMTSLLTLNISQNFIGNQGCDALASALHSMTALQMLNLKDNSLKVEGVVTLFPALRSLPSMQTLDIQNNFIIAADFQSSELAGITFFIKF